MPKRIHTSSQPVIGRRSPRRRLVPPTTFHGSGLSQTDPIVIPETNHSGDTVVDGGLYPPVVGLPIQLTTPTQADLDEQCIIIVDEVPSPSPISRSHLRGELRALLDEARALLDAWPDDGEFIIDQDHQDTPRQIRMATQIATNFMREPNALGGMTALQSVLLMEDNYPAREHAAVMCARRMGRELRRIPSDVTSLTLRSQDSTRSGGTEEYKRAELEEDTDNDLL